MRKKFLFALLIIPFIFTGCSTPNQSGQLDYDETKKMIVDILKTDDGKKALKEALSDKELKQELVMDNTIVADSIQATLISDKGKEFWKKAFEDPDFVKAFAESMKNENQTLLKGLLKDPDYRKMIIEILHDPELEKELSDLMKSTEYRKHLQSVISETIESPLYQAKIQEILLKAASEQQKKEGGGGGQ